MISSERFYYTVAKQLCSITKWKITLLGYEMPNTKLHLVLYFMSDEGFATRMFS